MNIYNFNITGPAGTNTVSCDAVINNPDENNTFLSINFQCTCNGTVYMCTFDESNLETLVRMYNYLHLLNNQNQKYMLTLYPNGTNNDLWIFEKSNFNQHSVVSLNTLPNQCVLQA